MTHPFAHQVMPSSLRTLALRPLALGVALMLSAGVQAQTVTSPQSSMARAEVETWNRALDDPRFRQLRTLDAAQLRDLAYDYGLERLLPGYQSPATTRTVTNCNAGGSGSLRDAVTSASSGDTIDARSLTCSGISIGNGAIVIPQNDLTIVGPGKDRFAITTKYANRIFTHTGTGTLTISGVTLRDGTDRLASGPKSGGCLLSYGNVALGNSISTDPSTGVAVSGCKSNGSGGGVFASATLRMSNSVISGNSADESGGGIYSRGLAMKYSEIRDNTATSVGGIATMSRPGSSVHIESSTIAGNISSHAPSNYAKYAGGALLYADDVKLINVTVSNNASTTVGGVQFLTLHPDASVLSIIASTFTGNTASTAGFGAGVSTNSLNITLESTLIWGNYAGAHVPSDLDTRTAPVAGSHNLVGAHNGVVPYDTLVGVDPKLGTLANHGGLTRTHLLLAGSPAIDAGNNSQQKLRDQRGPGFPRELGAAPDIGATEFDPDRIFNNGFD